MAQIAEAKRRAAVQVGRGNVPGAVQPEGSVAPTQSNPFSNLHAISPSIGVSINDVSEVGVSTYDNETEATGNASAAVVFDFVRRDGPTQHIVATFPAMAFSGDRTDGEAPEAATALSIHQEDGTSPSLFITPLPCLSPGDHTNQEAETHTISSVALTEAEVFQVMQSGQ